jgi:hypothetical protein
MIGCDNAAGDLHLATVVVNVQDMRRGVAFWCAALSYRPRETAGDPDFMMLVDARGKGTPVSLQLAREGPRERCVYISTCTPTSRNATSIG